MIIDLLKNNIQIIDSVESWEKAITISAAPLLMGGKIEERYIDAIIENVKINGNYIILLPFIAMPHARREYGALDTGLSLLKVKKPVNFPNNEPVTIFLTISANSDSGHLEMLSQLSEILIDTEKVDKLLNAANKDEILNVFGE
ncbi:PTS sugar transporter subunit IIA [Streptococcus uberis]|uniref:Ascorbate-specific PTS system EIIA component n=1 Tax=Streptococcus uberis (strain ATCC BAA-854 / 0140J) TaxID=218495 RepID=B9DTG3_STRU0|nr:PTS sugar transporter subunit IIA [Streptococcus uberis]KKF45618.1 PTS sugar transporter subunit IIA [Streptococcus uberis Ab71]KKF61034.1 PTS sugar transporter subunit IIA [Streptococcus uberis 6736]MCK1213493.1 PTS sugar transporter subunit IIA [Streptococcus uberis]MCK1241626.1 PTS sugar transporter subunit IIA [Streptococcus uberis]CAR40829.1 sugar phosphotransferase system (PTS), IIA component [Streptococcus uberis 0140J]